MYNNVNRYALLLVFEYKRVSNKVDSPKELYSMITDLKLAYDLSINKFNIPKQNISIITDVKTKDYPWLPLKCDNCNPKIKIIDHPDIILITREIAQFVENTIRGIGEINKGEDETNEVFIYISGHGYQISSDTESDKLDNSLHLTNDDGSKSRFLRNSDIFDLLFGKVPIGDNGSMKIPMTYRNLEINDTDKKLYYKYYEDTITFDITPLSENRSHHNDEIVTGYSPKSYNALRGLPRDTNMLMIIDTCNSGKMANFHYVYNPEFNNMEITHALPTSINSFPLCICISATEENIQTYSTFKGSPFTRYIYNLLKEIDKSLTIPEMYNLIYNNIPENIKIAKPNITSTSSYLGNYIPLLQSYTFKNKCCCKLCNEKNNCSCI